MRYIFMDNFRGFTKTLLPLRKITFLVGENSTGKSSFLKVANMLTDPKLWFSPGYALEEAELGAFEDIVSAWSSDKSYFRIGVIFSKEKKKGELSCSFSIFCYENRESTAHISRYVQYVDGQLEKIVFEHGNAKFKSTLIERKFFSEEEIQSFFYEIVSNDTADTEGFTSFPKSLSPIKSTGEMFLPLHIAIPMFHQIQEGNSDFAFTIERGIPFSLNLTWIAPIRSKPQRFYDGMRKSFTPEGDHTPYLLRRTLRAKANTSEFAKKLKAFGDLSGLFTTILPHAFGKSQQSPFEILVKFSNVQLNINNVGYGVSQVLPLIVEFLSSGNGRAFAVQQPEVHLHPRAQAALGDLIAQLAMEKEHMFILETHSDYLIDRCRLNIAEQSDSDLDAQLIFFKRISTGNNATVIPIGRDGKYTTPQPTEFREFFINEAFKMLDI